jgi:hypothetical protein
MPSVDIPRNKVEFASPANAPDPLCQLREYDVVFIIDDSSTMATGEHWKEAGQVLEALAHTAMQYDTDGIDIHFFNHKAHYRRVKNVKKVQQAFAKVKTQPGKPLGHAFRKILDQYSVKLDKKLPKKNSSSGILEGKQQKFGVKPVNFIIITDGKIQSNDPIYSLIMSTARWLDNRGADPAQVGIQFLQIGKDEEAAAFLALLDDEIGKLYSVRDMVDTVSLESSKTLREDQKLMMKALLGGIDRRIDNEGVACKLAA